MFVVIIIVSGVGVFILNIFIGVLLGSVIIIGMIVNMVYIYEGEMGVNGDVLIGFIVGISGMWFVLVNIMLIVE